MVGNPLPLWVTPSRNPEIPKKGVTPRGKPSELPDLGVFRQYAPPDLAKFFQVPATRLPKIQGPTATSSPLLGLVASTAGIQHLV